MTHHIKLAEPCITDEDITSVVNVLQQGWLVQGANVAAFEAEFAGYVGAKYALALNSATSALHVALLALGVGPGDEVIVPAFTWVATANVVLLCGAKPILVDIDCDTFNANAVQVIAKINNRTKAIIIVHLFGKPFDIIKLKKALPRAIPIIEDAACAAGAKIAAEFCGALGEMGVYSFHPRKSITTGEGGMVVTNDEGFYRHMAMLRNHGQDTFYREEHPGFMYDCPIVGFNYRMTDFQAALGRAQFKRIDNFIAERNQLANRYSENLKTCHNLILPQQNSVESHAWQAYVILVSTTLSRDGIMLALKHRGVETRPGTHAVHLLSYYKNTFNCKPEDFPNSAKAFFHSIALPLHNKMTIADADYVSQQLKEVLNAYK